MLTVSILIMTLVLFLDQGTKLLVVTNLAYGESIPILFHIVAITYVHNFGAAFGIFAGQRMVFILAVLVIVVVFIKWRKDFLQAGPLAMHGGGLLMGGALGNLVDRVRLGYVVDFIQVGWWPVFNIADSAIVIGAVSLVLLAIRSELQ